MTMDDSNRRQTIQAAIVLIAIVTFFGIILSVTSCSPTKTSDNSYTVKEKAYLSDVGPLLGSGVDTPVQQSAIISIGKATCQQRDAGISEESIIERLKNGWTELQARAMYSAASKYFCK